MYTYTLRAVGVLAVVLVSGCSFRPFGDAGNNPNNPVACTMEARQCADGSYVGRVPPKCEFAPCPGATNQTKEQQGKQTGDVAIGQSVTFGWLTVTPTKVIEDSRCPVDVTCVWAGTVKISARIASEETFPAVELELGKPMRLDDMSVTLVSVQPEAHSKTKISEGDYRFSFMVVPNEK